MNRFIIALVLAAASSACPPPRLDPGAQKGGVQFSWDSEPSGADISVDGIPRGMTPVTTSLTPGTHRVTMSKSGYFNLETTVEVTAGFAPIKHRFLG